LKKFLSILLIIVSFLIIYFIQSNFFTWFTIANVKPNLFVIFILCIGLFAGKKLGLIFGIIFGFFIDVVIGRQIGISGIMLGLIGLLGEYLDKNFSKESRITIMLMIAASTAIYEIGGYIFNIIALDINVEILQFIRILIIEVIYNLLITIVIYPLIQKIGHALEEVFKTKNILTRYF
jgi:rod shape-determining protein MreD